MLSPPSTGSGERSPTQPRGSQRSCSAQNWAPGRAGRAAGPHRPALQAGTPCPLLVAPHAGLEDGGTGPAEELGGSGPAPAREPGAGCRGAQHGQRREPRPAREEGGLAAMAEDGSRLCGRRSPQRPRLARGPQPSQSPVSTTPRAGALSGRWKPCRAGLSCARNGGHSHTGQTSTATPWRGAGAGGCPTPLLQPRGSPSPPAASRGASTAAAGGACAPPLLPGVCPTSRGAGTLCTSTRQPLTPQHPRRADPPGALSSPGQAALGAESRGLPQHLARLSHSTMPQQEKRPRSLAMILA